MSKPKKEKSKEIQPVMFDVVTDARLGLGKCAETLSAIHNTLKSEEIIQLENELEGLSYSFMLILMNAQEDLKGKDKKEVK